MSDTQDLQVAMDRVAAVLVDEAADVHAAELAGRALARLARTPATPDEMRSRINHALSMMFGGRLLPAVELLEALEDRYGVAAIRGALMPGVTAMDWYAASGRCPACRSVGAQCDYHQGYADGITAADAAHAELQRQADERIRTAEDAAKAAEDARKAASK